MTPPRIAEYVPYALALAVVLIAALVAGVSEFVPGGTERVRAVASVLPLSDSLSSVAAFVGLPLLLGLSVVARGAQTTSPVGVVLAAFAVPCLLASTWALYSYFFTHPGVYFGGLVALSAGTLLAAAVLVDGALSVLTAGTA